MDEANVGEVAIEREPAIDESKVKEYIYTLQSKQNFGLALLSGAVSALIGAIIWASFTVFTEHQIGWMAVGVGFLVGWTVKKFGKGIDKKYGYLGATLSLLGCLTGNFLTVVMLYSKDESISFLSVLSKIDFSKIPGVMGSTFQAIDIVFYGLAIYEGYKFSFRRITKAELQNLR